MILEIEIRENDILIRDIQTSNTFSTNLDNHTREEIKDAICHLLNEISFNISN